MEKIFEQTIITRNDHNVAEYYLLITQKIIKCVAPDERKLIFYLFDEEYQIYKFIKPSVLGDIIRKELIFHLNTKTKQTFYVKELMTLISKLGTKCAPNDSKIKNYNKIFLDWD